ncbi:hypothetical protein [Jannaschia sp. R86511]|uniref:hypothetical protein n=1 Tax=Jannaschia sp. R86511 TaxID=3093853 RepID=UPI0036D2C0C9
MNRFDTKAVIDLAEVVDRDGLDAHAATLFALAEQASFAGVSPVLQQVMLSQDEPYVARVRAFVLMSRAVVNRGGRRVRPADRTLVDATPVAA